MMICIINCKKGGVYGKADKRNTCFNRKDAERFIHEMKNVKSASEAEKQRVRASYEKIKKLATFMM